MTYFGDREVKVRGNLSVGGTSTITGATAQTGNLSVAGDLLGSNKYVTVDPNATGVIYQQASTMTIAANNSSASVTFPTAFSAAPRIWLQNATVADATATVFRAVASDTSTTVFVAKANNTATGVVTLYWFAHGLK